MHLKFGIALFFSSSYHISIPMAQTFPVQPQALVQRYNHVALWSNWHIRHLWGERESSEHCLKLLHDSEIEIQILLNAGTWPLFFVKKTLFTYICFCGRLWHIVMHWGSDQKYQDMNDLMYGSLILLWKFILSYWHVFFRQENRKMALHDGSWDIST